MIMLIRHDKSPPSASSSKKHAILRTAAPATCNHQLSRLFHVAASAANHQQTLADRLQSQGDLANAGRRACLGRLFEFLQAPVPRPLFPLFYLVEIRHPQLLQSASRTR
jgi:hypothetical protein